jgi:hypothetical protein
LRLASAYNRAREYLEDNGPVSVDSFKAQFNDQLFRAKGSEWIREGLLFEGATQERERETTREEFFKSAAEVKAERKISMQANKKPSRFRRGFTNRGVAYKYDMKSHRFTHINKSDERVLRLTKRDYRVNKRSPSKVKKAVE